MSDLTLSTIKAEIPRDWLKRPLVTPPNGGKPVPYSRCTTYVSAIEDTYHLGIWGQRKVAQGIAGEPDLAAAVRNVADPESKEGKKALNAIAAEASFRAGSKDASLTGTYVHGLTEAADQGHDLSVVDIPNLSTGPLNPAAYLADLDAYRAATVDLTHVLIEQFCVLDTLKIGGTPDRVVEYGGRRYIADVKTGGIDLGTLKIAAQLAVYSRSHTYDIATAERGMHEADTSRGIIIHVPAGTGTTSLHWVDLEVGWYAVQSCKDVREKRRLKFGDLTEPFGPLAKASELSGVHAPGATNSAMRRERLDLATLIRQCKTGDEVRQLWNQHARDWTDALTATAAAYIATLPEGSR